MRGQERRQRDKMRSEDVTVVQRGDRGLHKDDNNQGHRQWSDPRCILNVGLIELADGFDICFKEKAGTKYDSQASGVSNQLMVSVAKMENTRVRHAWLPGQKKELFGHLRILRPIKAFK